MATAAEPRPAELPLPGGREGARVRLRPLLTGQMKESRLAWRRAFGLGAKDEDWLLVPVPAFLVEHPGVGPILIDTGFHPSVSVKPQENLGRLSRLTFRDVEMTPEQAAPAQLRARGIEPSAVKVVLMTHLHVDRASAISEFPESTFVVSAAEWAAASSQGERHGYVKRQFDHGFDYRLLDFEGAGAESFSGFARSFDVFGDGSVRAVYTPGHTLGHMSVVLRTARGEVLIAGDAAYEAPDRTEDEHLFRRSLREIRQYAAETPDALIVPGHDWEAWQGLETAY
jgi:glyoxylase-like metal-dependent hydrolase (beta-lactamase superfamily II)